MASYLALVILTIQASATILGARKYRSLLVFAATSDRLLVPATIALVFRCLIARGTDARVAFGTALVDATVSDFFADPIA